MASELDDEWGDAHSVEWARTEDPPCAQCGFADWGGFTFDVGTEHTPEMIAQETESERLWRIHQAHVTRELLTRTSLDDLRKRFDISRIRKQYGSWAVTDYGLECLTNYYPISRKRLFEPYWESHMADHTWVLFEDFSEALKRARTLYRPGISKRQRYRVLARDGFRCQQCGRSPQDGIRLEAGHKVAVAKGGRSNDEDLFAQCEDCNDGQYTDATILPVKSTLVINKLVSPVIVEFGFDSESCF